MTLTSYIAGTSGEMPFNDKRKAILVIPGGGYGFCSDREGEPIALAFVAKGYKIVSGGTDNHLLLIDLRTKFPELTGKVAEKALVAADITVNKNMVPFDSRSPFQTSGIRVGTPAITSRGLKEADMPVIVELVDKVLSNPECEATREVVKAAAHKLMAGRPLNAW